MHTALVAFNTLRDERDRHHPENDWDTAVFAFDQGLAELGEKVAAAAADLLAALAADRHCATPPAGESVGDRR